MRKKAPTTVPRVSRTHKKQQALRLQRLGERLVALSPEQAAAIAMPEELAAAVTAAREMHKHGARRRQLQYVGALMRELDPEPIEAALANLTRGNRQEVRQFKQVEAWRDALLAGEGAVMAEIREACSGVEMDRIENLVAQARAAKATPAKRKAARRLFRYLKEFVTKY